LPLRRMLQEPRPRRLRLGTAIDQLYFLSTSKEAQNHDHRNRQQKICYIFFSYNHETSKFYLLIKHVLPPSQNTSRHLYRQN
jgi:hypothetical protein